MEADTEMAASDWIATPENPTDASLNFTFRNICYTVGKGKTSHPPLNVLFNIHIIPSSVFYRFLVQLHLACRHRNSWLLVRPRSSFITSRYRVETSHESVLSTNCYLESHLC